MITVANFEAAERAHFDDLSRRAGMKPIGNVQEDAKQALDRLDAGRMAANTMTEAERPMIYRNATRQRDPDGPMTDAPRRAVSC